MLTHLQVLGLNPATLYCLLCRHTIMTFLQTTSAERYCEKMFQEKPNIRVKTLFFFPLCYSC